MQKAFSMGESHKLRTSRRSTTESVSTIKLLSKLQQVFTYLDMEHSLHMVLILHRLLRSLHRHIVAQGSNSIAFYTAAHLHMVCYISAKGSITSSRHLLHFSNIIIISYHRVWCHTNFTQMSTTSKNINWSSSRSMSFDAFVLFT